MPNKYTLEAAPVDFRALEFKPQELKVEGPDMNLHAQALARYEQRKKEAQQQRASFDTTLEKIRLNLELTYKKDLIQIKSFLLTVFFY